MKKFYMILAAIAALTMTVQAQDQMRGSVVVGDFYNPTETYNGSYFDMAPTNFYLPHTGVQMIYTPDLLAGMNNKYYVEIQSLSFKFYSESFEEILRNAKVYLKEIDETEFAVVDGVMQFFTFGELVAEGQYDFDLLGSYGDDQVLTIELSEPFMFYTRSSLLVTIVFDAEDNDNCTMGSDYAPFYTSGISGKAMTYTSNWTSFIDYAAGTDFPNATAALGCGTNVDLPVTEIGYTLLPEPISQCMAPTCSYSINGNGVATVIITNNEPGATVVYEVYCDNDLIMESSFTGDYYTFEVSGTGQYLVQAVAKKEDMCDSAMGGLFFTILPQEQCLTPELSYSITGPEEVVVHFTNREEGATVYYEIYRVYDNSNQELICDGYFEGVSDNFIICGEGNYRVRAVAKMDGKLDSQASEMYFTILYVPDPCAAPNCSYSIDSNGVATVTITNCEPDATVEYEVYLDNELFMEGSFTGDNYTFNVSEVGTYTVEAYARKAGMSNSDVGGVCFTIVPLEPCLAPTMMCEETGPETMTVVITNREPGATVYYTTVQSDGMIVYDGYFDGDSYAFDVVGVGDYTVSAVAKMEGKYNSPASVMYFSIFEEPQPQVIRGDVNGVGGVDMDDLTALINYLLDPTTPINEAAAAIINDPDSTTIDMDDLTALINYLLNGTWDN